MAEAWPTVPLADVIRFQEGPGILAKDFRPNGVPLVRLSGLGGYEVTLKGCDYLDPETVERRWNQFKLCPGDILVSTSASFGRPAVVGSVAQGAIFYTGIIRFRSKAKGLDEGFLKTFLGSKTFMAQAEAMASGSVISHFGPSHLRQMEVPLPPLSTQRGVAASQAALDDKIELNRRINETLEAMAQAIFRDWFVDFGPVRRKLEGASDPVAVMGGLTPDPARAAALAALFPDALGDDGLPVGWDGGTLGMIAETAGESVDPSGLQPATPYIGLEHMPRRSIALSDWEGVGKVTSQKSRFTRGQVLFGKLRPYFHKVGIAPVDGVCSTDIVVLDSKDRIDRALVTCCTASEDFVAYTDQSSTGTKMPRTSWAQMRTYPLAVADKSVRAVFSEIVEVMFDKIVASIAESRTLAETRDYLLPRLMSGQVRVGEVGEIAGEVA